MWLLHDAWKAFDGEFPEFASDPRNVRLGLASDGFNPFGSFNQHYSVWPVVLIPYKLRKCMDREISKVANQGRFHRDSDN